MFWVVLKPFLEPEWHFPFYAGIAERPFDN
jgi:hypothetical protein